MQSDNPVLVLFTYYVFLSSVNVNMHIILILVLLIYFQWYTYTKKCSQWPLPTNYLYYKLGFLGKGSDHLQLIKFPPSCGPGNGVCSGANIFDYTLLQPACSVCISL